MSFQALGLLPELLAAIAQQGYTEPTPIQKQAIPGVLAGRDMMACAQTGTGKTAGFTLPMLQRLMLEQEVAPSAPRQSDRPQKHSPRRPLRALVLTPTRELAAQVQESIYTYGQQLPLRSFAIFGGVSINPQMMALRKGVDILVATPGRLLDHTRQRSVDLSQVEILILDEADRMLDMGFINDIRTIMGMVPKHRQTLMFSATFSDEIKALADRLLKNPLVIEVARRNTATELVKHSVYPVPRNRKRELLSFLIGSNNWQQVLVFTRTKHGADRLAEQLEMDGLETMAIHGNKSQGARTKALAQFKAGKLRVLVATDIAARGLDIDQLPHVVNYDLPLVPEDYVHRIGRTGRAGSEGEAISLVSNDERNQLRGIERLIRQDIERVIMAEYQDPRGAMLDDVPEDSRPQRRPASRGSRPGQGGGQRQGGQRREGGASGGRDGNRAYAPRHSDGQRSPRDRDANAAPRRQDDRRERPAQSDRPARSEHFARPARSDRPAGMGDRPARSDRPARAGDRPARSEGAGRSDAAGRGVRSGKPGRFSGNNAAKGQPSGRRARNNRPF